MKKLIMFVMVIAIAVLVFSGIASAQNVPVCITLCPPDVVAGETLTMTAYDENGDMVDLSEFAGFEVNFEGSSADPYGFTGDSGEYDAEIVDGTFQFTMQQEFLDHNRWVIGGWGEFDWLQWLAVPESLLGCGDCGDESNNFPGEYRTVAEALAAEGTCEGGCGGGPPKIVIVDANDIYEPKDDDPPGPEPEGPTSDKMLVSLPAVPYAANTITVIIDPNLDGNGPHEDFIFPAADPNGNRYLTFTEANWNIPQEVAVEAVEDTEREGDESYNVLFTCYDLLGDPNFNSDPCDPPLTTRVTVIDNDIPYVSAIPDEIELSENDGGDPCACVELKVRLSHVPTHDVYVRVYSEGWPFGADDKAEMASLDPPLEPHEGPVEPNVLTFTVTGNTTWDPCTMTSDWNVEQTITVCPIDNDELAEAWIEWVEGALVMDPYSEDVRYLGAWLNPDGSSNEEENSGGLAGATIVDIVVQDNECGAVGFARLDFNEDCTVGLADFVDFYTQWLICTQPYDSAGDCDKLWNLVGGGMGGGG